MYKVIITQKADKQLRKMNKSVSNLLYKWIYNNLKDCENPRQHGKALSGDLAGLWRYRVGNYRIISEIRDDQVIILILEVGHRKEIYE